MQIIDIILVAAIVLILGGVVLYIRKAKKKGVKCIGCPSGKTCGGNCGGCSGNCCGSK